MSVAAVEYLTLIEQQNHSIDCQLPKPVGEQHLWSGVGFVAADHELLVVLDKVVEIIEDVHFTALPNVASWFLGLSNVRGNLMPVVDLTHYLFGIKTARTDKMRILVLKDEPVNIGFVISAVLGMRYFQPHQRHEPSSSLNNKLSEYIHCAYQANNEYWNEFDFDKLIHDHRFIDITQTAS